MELKFKSDCRKICYASKKVAKAEMKRLNKWHKLGLTDVYYCEYCSAWHTTSAHKITNRNYNHIKVKLGK